MARRPVSYELVKELVSYRAVFELLGWRPTHHEGRWFRGRCPLGLHPTGSDREFNAAAEGWHCFKCGQGGDQLKLWQLARGLDALDAAVDLCERLGIDPPYLPRRPRQPRKPRVPRGQRRGGGAGGAGASPASSSTPRSGPAEGTQDAGDRPARGSGEGEIGGPERS